VRVESAGTVISIARQIASLQEQARELQQKAAKVEQESDKALREYVVRSSQLEAERDSKVAALIAEKEASLEDFQAGLFCSQCSRSKTKIEADTKKSFQEHLTEVSGKAIPMSPEKIAKQMLAYDQRIAALRESQDKRLASLKESYERRSDSFISTLVRYRTRVQVLYQIKLPDLRGKLRVNLRAYDRRLERLDSEWLRGWASRRLSAAGAGARAALRLAPAIGRARAELREAELQGDRELVVAKRTRLDALLDQRRSARLDGAKREMELKDQFEAEQEERATARAEEEQRVVDALREAGEGGYSPQGLRLGGAWHSESDGIAELGNLEFQAGRLEGESRRSRSAELVEQRRSAFLRTAERVGRSAADWIRRRPQVVKRNIQRLGEGLSSLRQWIRDVVVPESENARMQDLLTGEWRTRDLRGHLKSTRNNVAIHETRQWVVDTMEEEIRRNNPDMSDYEIRSRLRELSPKHGVDTWYQPWGDGLEKYLDDVFEPFEADDWFD